MSKLNELHLDAIESKAFIDIKKNPLIENTEIEDFQFINGIEKAATKSAEITEQIAIEFLEWCNYQVVNPQKVLGFDKRVTPQYPDFKTYTILNNKGKNILPEGKFLTTQELFQEFLKQRQ